MFRNLSLVVMSVLMVGVLSTSNVQANCDWDAVGVSNLTPPYSFTPDGRITFGNAAWWEDDVMACYNVFLTPAYLFFFPLCDHDGSGAVEIAELLNVYNFVLDHPNPLAGLPGEPPYAYTCPVQCDDDSDCAADEYCFFEDTCGGTGTCEVRGEMCYTLWEPVCGCDGQTYSNDCFAAIAGTSVAYEGECDPGCQSNGECAADEYCYFESGCGGTGSCEVRGEMCYTLWDPVCGCDGQTYSNDCFAAVAGTSVAYEGEC